jgi:hypothetical protein
VALGASAFSSIVVAQSRNLSAARKQMPRTVFWARVEHKEKLITMRFGPETHYSHASMPMVAQRRTNPAKSEPLCRSERPGVSETHESLSGN